jgi:hypothetical protein
MREIKIGEKEIRVRATTPALLFYKQEFGTTLTSDLTKLQKALGVDSTNIDDVVILQITYAMAKADAGFNAKFPSFNEWVDSIETFDFSDKDLVLAVMEEAASGFFRKGFEEQRARKSKRSGKS